jgi:hypothetical protein
VKETNAREIKDKAVTHLREHKEAYAFGTVCLIAGVLAGIARPIVRSNTAQWGVGEGTARGGVANTASLSLIFRNQQSIKVTTVLDREGRGHPGWPCRNLETKRTFLSQREAANYYGIPEGILSGHITGKFPDANGLHFERVNLVEAK